jgi:tetrapyrrole methylase family protein/MazG family protein
MIYVIGCSGGELTPRQIEAINNCAFAAVKSEQIDGFLKIKSILPQFETLDEMYRKARNFDTLNAGIARHILKLSKEHGSVAYIVGGSGYEDRSVMLLKRKTKDVTILPAKSAAGEALSAYPSSSYTVYSAADLISAERIAFSKDFPLIIYEVYDKLTASDVKLILLRFYGEDTEVYCFGAGGDTVKTPLHSVDRLDGYSHKTCFMLPPQELLKQKRFDFNDFLGIMGRLLGEGGCPWDREQTHESIRNNAIEEAYELSEAILKGDLEGMEEESGDLLLQPVFHAHIAQKQGNFDIYDVITALCRKLIFRHSHIFGPDSAKKADEALVTWEKNKSIEKNQTTVSKTLIDVAKTLPAVMRCQKVQKKAAKVGFDFENVEQVFGKVDEELAELKQAVSGKDSKNIEEECGDLLFAAVNAARMLGVEGERALNATTDKFIRRFEYLEKKINEKGKKLEEVTLEEMERYYIESKKYENGDA